MKEYDCRFCVGLGRDDGRDVVKDIGVGSDSLEEFELDERVESEAGLLACC